MLVELVAANTDALLWSLCFILIIWRILKIVVPPLDYPRNIPTVPFYASFMSPILGWDQRRIYDYFYREKLEKYGAAKIYFGSRWNILVTKPEYLVQVLKQNDIFEKSGNQKKIPYSVLADYTGDNIISTGNTYWKLYRKVVTKSIQFPDLEPLKKNSAELIRDLLSVANRGHVSVSDFFQRFTLSNIGNCVIGVEFQGSAKSDGFDIYTNLKEVKLEIFRPMFLNFPMLDILPIPSRIRARKLVHLFRTQFCNKILDDISFENSARLGPMLAFAWDKGEITEKQFQDNSMIAMIAGHENPQLLLTSLMYIIAKHQPVQKALRNELAKVKAEERDNVPYLNSIVFETLRLFPPLGLIVNRITTRNVVLGSGILIPKGVYVGYNNFGTQRDPNYWGQDADLFRPDRWGLTAKEIEEKYSLAKSNCTLPAFHGRGRACLGEKFALAEVKRALIDIVENFEISLDPTWKERITPAGPISPFKLSVMLKKICSDSHNT